MTCHEKMFWQVLRRQKIKKKIKAKYLKELINLFLIKIIISNLET
jgi:hypothetical protein